MLSFVRKILVIIDILAKKKIKARRLLTYLITITDEKPTKLSQSKHVLYYYIRLTIVRKIDAGDGSYPSVNTCVHYLKVSCNDILKKC